MARKLSIIILCLVQMLVLLVENRAEIVVSTIETPAPAPQPTKNTTHFPNLQHGITEGSLQPEECGPRCKARCSNTQYKKSCLFFCKKCCAKCLCVPPGTYGNKQVCPCYNKWKTKRGGPKCP